MKKILVSILMFVLAFSVSILQTEAYVNVKGYYKKNGTYVAPHVRSNPNGLKYDNYSYKPSQGLYNDSYGTRGANWDTPTYVTDPNYYAGKNIYESNNYAANQIPNCPLNSYYDGISSCKCNYGYFLSGSKCVSGNTICKDQMGIMSSYDSLSGECRCDHGYVIGNNGQCVSGNTKCSSDIGFMSRYNSITNKCECLSGYEFDGYSCKSKSKTPTSNSLDSYYVSNNKVVAEPVSNTVPSGLYLVTKYSNKCPNNSNSYSLTQCSCNSGYEHNALKTGCTNIDLGCINGAKFSHITGSKCLTNLKTDTQGCVSIHDYSLTTGKKCVR